MGGREGGTQLLAKFYKSPRMPKLGGFLGINPNLSFYSSGKCNPEKNRELPKVSGRLEKGRAGRSHFL